MSVFLLIYMPERFNNGDWNKNSQKKPFIFSNTFFFTRMLHNNVSPNIYLMKTTQSSRGNLSCIIPGGFLTGKGVSGTCGLTNLYLYVAETLESCGSLECKVERGGVGREAGTSGGKWMRLENAVITHILLRFISLA